MGDSGLRRDPESGVIYRSWQCGEPRAVFLLVHGLGGHSGRWNFLADFFLNKNISSYAIELKGFGETEGLKGHIDSLDIYFQDIQLLCGIIKKENSGKKIFLVGESMGALISFCLAGLMPDLFNGIICISPAFKSRMVFGRMEKIQIYSSMLFSPKRQFQMPFDSRMCTRDLDYQKAMDSDKREHKLATARLLLTIILAQAKVNALKKKIKIPVLFLVAGELDKLIDPQEAKKVFYTLKLEDKEIIEYPDMYHSLPIDLEREKVFQDILSWINKRI